MLGDMGSHCPREPYVDPHQPELVRVPIASRKHEGMEAIIDAADLPLVEGRRCYWLQTGEFAYVAVHLADGSPTPLRRVILGVSENHVHVGHLNGDPLD